MESNEYEAGWARGPIFTFQKETLSSLPAIEPRFIDHPASSLVPYPLSYPASPIYLSNSKTNLQLLASAFLSILTSNGNLEIDTVGILL